MCQGGVWTCSYKGFADFGKGVPHILLIKGEFGRGICWTKKLKIWPEPKHPKNVPKGPRAPQALPKIIKHIFGPPGPSRAHGAQGANPGAVTLLPGGD